MIKKKIAKDNEDVKSVHDMFTPARQINPMEGLKIAVWGEPNAGKTYLGFSFPKPIYIIDVDGASSQILDNHPDKEKLLDEIFIYKVPQTNPSGDSDPGFVLNDIKEKVTQIKKDLSASETPGTVIIDTTSEILQLTNQWLETNPDVKKYRSSGTVMRTEWAIRDNKYLDTVKSLFDMDGWTILFTGHSSVKYDSNGNPTHETYPKMHASTFTKFDMICELRRDSKGKRTLTVTKDRKRDFVGDKIEEVSFDGIMKHLTKKRDDK